MNDRTRIAFIPFTKTSLYLFVIRAASSENLSSIFPTRSNTNRVVQPQKMARGLAFRDLGSRWIVLNLCSENKAADQLRGYRAAVLHLCFSHMQKQVFS